MRDGSVVAYPTDSSYALGCLIGDKEAMERIRRIRDADKNHNFTLVCRDLSEIAKYARVGQHAVPHAARRSRPGPTRSCSRRRARCRSGCRTRSGARSASACPDNAIVRMLLAELGEPIMSSTLLLPGDDRADDRPARDQGAARARRSTW
ncbi:MAG: Sua5/YciO/YrdC/YwlC family protein [Chromatiales bacterium]|nr:Sua5/YciO/YrdC/YwlC family protein [Chromatiales bacterium]